MSVPERAFICCSQLCTPSSTHQPLIPANAAVAKVSSNSERSALWENGKDIRILFLNGSDSLKNSVLLIAKQWTEFANLGFVKVDQAPAEIRIEFDNQGVSYSYVGNEALLVSDQSKPTMKFGWLNETTSEKELKRVVLHEFGHAIGLQHEHQSPESDIQWDLEKVYAYFKGKLLPPNGGSWQSENEYRQHVNTNVIQKLSESDVKNSRFDQNSIMLYHFPSNLTLNGTGTKDNFDLSDLDKQFIGIQYPGLSSIRSWYQKYLSRNPEPMGLEHWRKEIAQKGPDYVENWIKNSPEAKDGSNRALIVSYYREHLKRDPESSGLEHWLGIAREQGIQSVKDQIEHSDEAKGVKMRSAIESYYIKYLGRGSDPSGMNHWLAVASNKGLTTVEDWIKNSPEAKNRQ